jgi:hypothetical protein
MPDEGGTRKGLIAAVVEPAPPLARGLPEGMGLSVA